MDSIKKWAKLNSLDYHFFDKPLDDFDPTKLLEVTWEATSTTTRNGQFYKWQWVNSLCDEYDYIIWIDADVYAWGNPRLPKDFGTDAGRADINKFYCMHNRNEMIWMRPNLSIFWSSSKTIREIYNWYEEVLYDRSKRDDLFTTLLTLCKEGVLGDFTEEVALISWVYANQSRSTLHSYITEKNPDADTFWAFEHDIIPSAASVDSFLHFTGNRKLRQFQGFGALRAYISWVNEQI